jgi:predicted kinase
MKVGEIVKTLYIMRGIPGSGKSTQAKKLVGAGKIFSTDDLIEATGDYNGFFASMSVKGDFTPLRQMHEQNLNNVKAAFAEGVSPIIVDNTNLSAREAAPYVKAATENNYDVKIIDVGLGGADAETLTKRNKHNVPLEGIKRMIDKYKTLGNYTIEDCLYEG